MKWIETERHFRRLQKEKERLEVDALDRELRPDLYQKDMPAIRNRGDLLEGDHARDKGKG